MMHSNSILIAGHSHIMALGVPLTANEYEVRPVANGLLPVVGLVGGWPREDTDYWEQVARHASGRSVVILWRGNQHFHHFLMMPGEEFDFVLDDEPHRDVDPSREIVPETAIIEFMRSDMADLDAIIEAIHSAGGRVVLCGTPPPKGDADFVRGRILVEDYFRNTAEELGIDPATIEISPPLLLYKLWKVMQNALRDVADRHGTAFVPVPDALLTSDGFLRPEHYAGDATHANRTYGSLMVETLVQALAQDPLQDTGAVDEG